MTEVDLEPSIIEDLVRYGRERGMREGVERGPRESLFDLFIRKGVERGPRESLFDLVAARGWSLTAEQHAQIDGEHNTERLARWLRLAALGRDVAEIFADGDQKR